ncbi:hypothetical protein NQ314_008697 [Rhamnusium bicolor]|uniref:DUF4817 domain-containing protein n=1 Tax=Rhamnusium bicolor TaxID=1586634 RepID=A0AAV8Y7U9_9CUCU|nr:hypothetical protein NQ314_008697 [Rhamnusium bicolor]
MSNSDTSSDEDYDEDEDMSNVRHADYTQEQKIVSAVWVHEKQFNGQTYEDLRNNFYLRFKRPPPKSKTLARWEHRLFTQKISRPKKDRIQKASRRLMHIPYIKASFREKPNLTLSERAIQLGLSRSGLHRIIKNDLKESDLRPQNETVDGEIENNSESKHDISTCINSAISDN